MTVTLKLAAAMLTVALVSGLGRPAAALAQGAGATPSTGAPQEGITVHGRWTVEVRNPDGSLASRHEFNNALVPIDGSFALTGLLSGYYRAVQQWRIVLVGQAGICQPGLVTCDIVQHSGPGPAPMGTLTAIILVANADAPVLRIDGMTQVTNPGTITSVGTQLNLCFDDACAGTVARQFTAHQLPSPIPVAASQVVQVSVEISFS